VIRKKTSEVINSDRATPLYCTILSVRFLLAMALCLCLCLSVTSRCYIETDGRDNLFFGMGGLLSTNLILLEEIHISTKIRVLPSG